MSKKQAEELVTAYRQGTAIRELCLAWQVNKDTVYEHLRRAGVTSDRVNKLGPAGVQRAAELYASGLSLKAVGAEFGVDAQTVRNALAAAGVPIRPRRGWPPTG